MDHHRPAEMGVDLLPAERWEHLFTPEGLAGFTPSVGTPAFVPMVEVFTLEEDGAVSVVLHILVAEGFDDQKIRFALMRGLGQKWADDGWKVIAVRLACEAWMRVFTDKEEQERGDRAVASYPDKQEVLMVVGITLGGRAAMAIAPLKRGADFTITGLGEWEVRHRGRDVTTLNTHLLNVALEAYAKAVLERSYEIGQGAPSKKLYWKNML